MQPTQSPSSPTTTPKTPLITKTTFIPIATIFIILVVLFRFFVVIPSFITLFSFALLTNSCFLYEWFLERNAHKIEYTSSIRDLKMLRIILTYGTILMAAETAYIAHAYQVQ